VVASSTNDRIVGSTTISGGLGVEPKAKEAKLFLWDPIKNAKVDEITPFPGMWMITCLMMGLDDNVWGVADDKLFVFDVAARKVVFSKMFFPIDEESRHAR
jgi:hypothetical protein